MPEHPQHSRPLWLAALLTPVLVVLGYCVLMIVIGASRGKHALDDAAMRGFAVIVLWGLPACAVAMWLLGLPIVLAMRSVGRLNVLNVCIAASITGALAYFVLVKVVDLGPFDALQAGMGVGLGLFAGLAFCLIAGIRFTRR